MDFYAKPPGNDWEHRGLLVKKHNRFKGYAGYHNAMAWGPEKKTLHMSVGFYLGYNARKGEHTRDPRGYKHPQHNIHTDYTRNTNPNTPSFYLPYFLLKPNLTYPNQPNLTNLTNLT